MPKLSDTMTEGTLVAWKKKKGDQVSAGEVIAEIETDKATMEWEASDDGILAEIYVPEGGQVSVGEPIAFLQAKGETVPTTPAAAPKTKTVSTPKTKTTPAPVTAVPPAPVPVAVAPAQPVALPPAAAPVTTGQRVKASPLAKKVAAEKGVELSAVTGTGPGARIVQRDVLAAAATGSRPIGHQAPSSSGSVTPATAAALIPAGTQQRIPLTGMRKVIAERLLLSKTTIPHFYLSVEVDAAALMRLRVEVNASAEKAGLGKFTVNDFVLKAAIAAVVKVPKVNASFDKDAVIQYGSVNLAVAVAIDDGLVTPVLRDAQTKSLREINEGVKDLASRARTKKLKPDEYQGGTLTVSNLGAYGIDSFSAIINPPQAIILSIGAIVKKPVVNENDEIVVGQRMAIGMSCDHRVVDGAIGAEYLAELKRLIENPTLMLI